MKNKVLSLIVALSFLLIGCADQLEITPPNSITDEQIMKLLESGNEAQIDMILGGMANQMPLLFKAGGIKDTGSDIRYNTPQGLMVMRNLEANDIVFGTTHSTAFGADEYNFRDFTSSSIDKNKPYWFFAWNIITTANKLLFYLQDDNVVNANNKLKDYKARALTMRAYAYNFLMENYQDAYLQGGKNKLGIMLYDTFSPTQQMKARASSDETYSFIKKDLNDAIALFKSANIGITEKTTDIDLGVANFILARVSLWTGDWAKVIEATNVILAEKPSLMTQEMYGGKNTGTDDNPVFLPESNGFLNNTINPEVMLGWPVGEANTTHNAWMNPFGTSQGGLSGLYQRIDNRLYEKISDNDFRKDAFLGNTAFGSYIYPPNNVEGQIPSYINLKFAATHGMGSNISDRTQVGRVTDIYMRTSELLLMKAEAYAQQGNDTEAKNVLNTLLAARTKEGAPTLTCDNYPAMQGLTAMQMVQLQYRIELWGEGGYEFYNNKRWNIPVDRTSSANHVNKGTYSVADMTLDIPDDEMFYNPYCEQN
ncbi:RagB/SusD family nutrient uptake outer membrane protein [Petrimonas mucosa]|jgi:hypothetical protein|uniref:RagB/SusD family nutrient uptake outer membrane protein n=1 Tax=Petrimonas mucosa TaxID=1642646 RepID=UPI001762AC9B|nr:RagB/SusD family nutrient uptake outer membrane protein [Petrimonas mucosa]HHT30420.1 RagB/SusD family nutrient uptake outer membrane protein [Petrimonas mucosa]